MYSQRLDDRVEITLPALRERAAIAPRGVTAASFLLTELPPAHRGGSLPASRGAPDRKCVQCGVPASLLNRRAPVWPIRCGLVRRPSPAPAAGRGSAPPTPCPPSSAK